MAPASEDLKTSSEALGLGFRVAKILLRVNWCLPSFYLGFSLTGRILVTTQPLTKQLKSIKSSK